MTPTPNCARPGRRASGGRYVWRVSGLTWTTVSRRFGPHSPPTAVTPTTSTSLPGLSGSIGSAGKVPVKTGTRIEVKHRSGETYTTTAGGDYASRWTHTGLDTDIVAYKVVK